MIPTDGFRNSTNHIQALLYDFCQRGLVKSVVDDPVLLALQAACPLPDVHTHPSNSRQSTVDWQEKLQAIYNTAPVASTTGATMSAVDSAQRTWRGNVENQVSATTEPSLKGVPHKKRCIQVDGRPASKPKGVSLDTSAAAENDEELERLRQQAEVCTSAMTQVMLCLVTIPVN